MSRSVRTPVWLDCDTGHDDAFAILLAGHSAAVRLLGISTVFGNAPLKNTTYNSRAILHAIGREDVPVYPGATSPLVREAVHAGAIHGESGLDGTTLLPVPEVPERNETAAIDAMFRALSAQPTGSSWLVATGALTNVARLFAKYPELVDHLQGVSIMGGAVGGGFTKAPLGTVEGQGERFGNYSPYAEFNIYIDPEAASFIFSIPTLAAKTTLLTLDLTHQFLATSQVQSYMLLGHEVDSMERTSVQSVSTVRQLFVEIMSFFKDMYANVFGLPDAPMHDPLAVAAVIAPELFYCNDPREANADAGPEERYSVEIVTEGEHLSTDLTSSSVSASQLGRTKVTLLPTGQPGVRLPRGLDVKANWNMLAACLARSEEALRRRGT